MQVIGLKTCDKCRAARRALEAAGHAPAFRDLRAEPPERAEIARLHAQFGEGLVNRRSTTWRQLDADQRGADPVDLILAHPSVMTRPVIVDGETALLGWGAGTRRALGV